MLLNYSFLPLLDVAVKLCDICYLFLFPLWGGVIHGATVTPVNLKIANALCQTISWEMGLNFGAYAFVDVLSTRIKKNERPAQSHKIQSLCPFDTFARTSSASCFVASFFYPTDCCYLCYCPAVYIPLYLYACIRSPVWSYRRRFDAQLLGTELARSHALTATFCHSMCVQLYTVILYFVFKFFVNPLD